MDVHLIWGKGVVIEVGDTGYFESVRVEELKKFKSKPPPTGMRTGWARLIGTKAAAEWACNAAAQIALDV